MTRTYVFDAAGQWSGGGRAFLSNAAHAARRHPIMNGGGDAVPIIPRNVPARGRRRPGLYVLAPQNAWPWAPRARGVQEVALVTRLRLASEYYQRKADAVLRISEAIPVRAPMMTSQVIHNVLDTGFEDALRGAADISIEPAVGRLVSIGSGYSYRNLSRLVRGYQRYRLAGGERELWISGPKGTDSTARSVEAIVATVPGVILKWGPLTRAEILAAFRDSAGVVLPSLVEASPLSALEAAAVTPRVILSDIAGHRGILGSITEPPDGAYFDPRCIQAIADSLSAVIQGPLSTCHDVLMHPITRERERDRWGDRLANWLEQLA